jgi:xanthine dehydrogenase FAD-binding subunit
MADKMIPFFRPSSLSEALRLRKETGAIPLAGGTDLMVKHQRWTGLAPDFKKPILLINHLAELKTIRIKSDFAIVGPCIPLAELMKEPAIPPFFHRSLQSIASPAIRNMATLGGNICNASPAGDTLPFLYAAEAMLICENEAGQRLLPVADFICGPGKTNLREDELLTGIRIPLTPFDWGIYEKVGARKANSIGKISFMGLIRRDNGVLKDVRIAFGAVGPTVIRSRDIEAQLLTVPIPFSLEARESCISAYQNLIQPIDDQRSTRNYRKSVATNLLANFLQSLGNDGQKWEILK